ncbi:MAG: hypothetical protein KatS3mg122_0612 [Caldimonas sp.]|uniref:glycosyltransferase family 2 protein n=1 Tax=Caldimonas taiwanensis TaxID=307483 RepID=UPI0007843528|nr:glycosyltransferase family A protein [Caldimonas taiwanensis]GIX23381.1 MAG: hypothetical protein KatS3mg122_0612 [Caldimonas sp.]
MERSQLGVVVIGRNEGERLRRCLESVCSQADHVVYVDSGSTDGSLALAQGMGVACVELDMTLPFTAARARNAGWRRLLQLAPEIRWIQFVDGDCEVVPGWLTLARTYLVEHPRAAAVCGQRRERHPERSVYNRLCDLEWIKPPGKIPAFGGDVMLRAEVLRASGGYRDDLIAGEEPELCVRLRRAGWEIHALPDDMTLHDANMTRFWQWWRRVVRSGYAYAAGMALHGGAPERHWVRESARTWFWSLGPMALVLVLLPAWGLGSLAILGVYPLQVLRLFLKGEGSWRDRGLQSVFHTLSRFPELVGQCRYLCDRWLRRPTQLIEYK